jgi:hypothetical protein
VLKVENGSGGDGGESENESETWLLLRMVVQSM